jgi:hypothetical protein
MTRVALLLRVSLGCGNHESAGAARCKRVVDKAENRIDARERAIDPDYQVTPETVDMIKNVLVASCKSDGWSDKLVACMDDVTDDDSMFKCFDYLTPDQTTELKKSLLVALAKKRAKELPPGVQ